MAERRELVDMLKSFGEEIKQLRSNLATSEWSRTQLEQSVQELYRKVLVGPLIMKPLYENEGGTRLDKALTSKKVETKRPYTDFISRAP